MFLPKHGDDERKEKVKTEKFVKTILQKKKKKKHNTVDSVGGEGMKGDSLSEKQQQPKAKR